ncbi:hypothetical protein HYU21_02955, partial [Candidatus Woesearchaeota archaeon]|nr:hypothetical protein [Candidatus Woesearchaeota archaeon]
MNDPLLTKKEGELLKLLPGFRTLEEKELQQITRLETRLSYLLRIRCGLFHSNLKKTLVKFQSLLLETKEALEKKNQTLAEKKYGELTTLLDLLRKTFRKAADFLQNSLNLVDSLIGEERQTATTEKKLKAELHEYLLGSPYLDAQLQEEREEEAERLIDKTFAVISRDLLQIKASLSALITFLQSEVAKGGQLYLLGEVLRHQISSLKTISRENTYTLELVNKLYKEMDPVLGAAER